MVAMICMNSSGSLPPNISQNDCKNKQRPSAPQQVLSDYFGQADGRLRSSAQRETLAELTIEIDNFRTAWEWAHHGEFALIEQTMRTFWMLYDTRGWLQEGLDMLGRAISALERAHGGSPSDRTNQVALGHILTSHAVLATRLGQQEQAQAT